MKKLLGLLLLAGASGAAYYLRDKLEDLVGGCNRETGSHRDREITVQLRGHGEAQLVAVAGSFNGWDVSQSMMTRTGDGSWQKKLILPPGRYPYKFLVDGAWLADPDNPEVEPDGLGQVNSVLVVE